jgi:hypothetical protein
MRENNLNSRLRSREKEGNANAAAVPSSGVPPTRRAALVKIPFPSSLPLNTHNYPHANTPTYLYEADHNDHAVHGQVVPEGSSVGALHCVQVPQRACVEVALLVGNIQLHNDGNEGGGGGGAQIGRAAVCQEGGCWPPTAFLHKPAGARVQMSARAWAQGSAPPQPHQVVIQSHQALLQLLHLLLGACTHAQTHWTKRTHTLHSLANHSIGKAGMGIQLFSVQEGPNAC